MDNNIGVKQQATNSSCGDNKESKRKPSFKSIVEKYKPLIGSYVTGNYFCSSIDKCYLYIKNIEKCGNGPSSRIEIEFYSFMTTELSESYDFKSDHNTFSYGSIRDAERFLQSLNVISKDELKSKLNDVISKIKKWANLWEMVD
jgi:hypothetical protein